MKLHNIQDGALCIHIRVKAKMQHVSLVPNLCLINSPTDSRPSVRMPHLDI